ncbi:tetratricopeptide repeat protein [Euzebya tangerina]|uniref:tetratricopeptide repeat protein n=1 Tax=Euzebya tangerina TaxID=591198 RepID=UPI000E31641B|nr:tetratricopeptide repeat protein [Euzebya tangerina]
MTDMRMRALVDRRAMALRDLEETSLQVSQGEIDADTADELLGRFRRDVARVEREIEELDEDLDEVQPPDTASKSGRSSKRALAGVLGLVVLLAAAGVVMMTELDDRAPGGFVTNADEDIPPAGRDLADVTMEEMEEVVAANPQITDMRLALADRYFMAGDDRSALDHYMVVLEQRDEPEAMTRVASILAGQGEVELAEELANLALREDPDSVEARYVLASVQIALGQASVAVETLAPLLARTDLSPADARTVDEIAEQAEQAAG